MHRKTLQDHIQLHYSTHEVTWCCRLQCRHIMSVLRNWHCALKLFDVS